MESNTIMLELVQRIAKMEARYEEHHKDLLLKFDQTREADEKQEARLRVVEDALTKYQGAWGLITIIGGALATCAALFWDTVRERLFG